MTVRKKILCIFFILIPAGLFTKFYSGPASHWVYNYSGGIFYVVFWCLFILFIRPRGNSALIALSVLFVTVSLECTQLWHPRFLESIRSTFAGRSLVGTSFSWMDIPHYIIGSFAGWVIMRRLQAQQATEEETFSGQFN